MKLTCPKAAKFNVSKKLSQLNKVIALFTTQAQEREFQLNYLHQKYNPEIDQVIQQACNYRQKLSLSLDKDKEEIFNNYKNQYKDKYDGLVTDLASVIEKANSLHTEKIENIEKETETLKSLLKSLTENSKEKQKSFLKNIEVFKSDLSDRMNQMREKYKAERDAHSAEAEKRIREYKKESEERLKQLQSDHNEQMIILRKDKKTDASIDCSKIKPGLQRLHDAIQIIMGHKNKLLQMQQTIKKNIQNTKNQIDSEIQLILKISKENKELLLKMDEQVEEIERPNKEMLEQLKQSQKDQLIQFAKLEEQKKNEFLELCARLKQEYADTKMKNKEALSQFNAIFGDLQKQQQEELEKLKAQYLQFEKEMEANQSKIQAEIKQNKSQYKKLKAQINSELDELRKKHEVEKSDIGHVLYQERDSEITKHQNDIKLLKEKINAALGDDARKGLEVQESLNSLKNQKLQIIQSHEDEMNRFQSQEEDEFEQLKSSFNNKMNELQNQITNSIDQLARENDTQIQNTIESNNKIKNEMIKKYQIINENEINDIKKAGYSKDEYKKLEAYYIDLDKQLQDELNKIQPPKLEDNDFYKNLMKTINELTKDVDVHTKNNQNEKNSILKKYTEDEEAENKRHNEAIRPTSSGRNRDQAKIGMMKQIDDMRKLKNAEIAKYNKILEELIQKHMQEMSELENEKNKAMQKEKIDGLNSDLIQTTKECEKRIQDHTNHFDSICNEKNIEIEKTTIHYIQEATNHHSRIDQMTAEFEALKNELLKQINSIQKQSENDINDCNKTLEKNVFNSSNAHSMSVHKMTQDINSLKTSIPLQREKNEKEIKDNSSQRQNEIDEYARSRKLEISDIKNKWKGMEEFFEERISVLSSEREKFKKLFEQRPSRECDIETIALMSEHLKMITNQLNISLKDYTQYKQMYVQQEKKYNAMFGKNPKVGTLQFSAISRPTHV